MNDSKLHTVEDVRARLATPEGKAEVVRFIADIRRRCESNADYEDVCFNASAEALDVRPQKVIEVFKALEPFMQEARPGHDLGHFYRDFLHILSIIVHDPYASTAPYLADKWAGLFGGAFHDCAVAVWPRYQDNEWECGHAEIGAWLFNQVTRGILGQRFRMVVCYAIAAHTHLTKPIEVTSPVSAETFTRLPYNDEIFRGGIGEQGPVRVGVWLTRFADRLDNNGATLWARDVLAKADSFEQRDAKDFSAGQFYAINRETVNRLLLPEVVGGGDEGTPSTLKHMLNFADSNYNSALPYGQHDAEFPVMQALLTEKVGETRNMVMIATTGQVDLGRVASEPSWHRISDFLVRLSHSQSIDQPLEVLRKSWDNLDLEQRVHLDRMVHYAESAYDQFMRTIKEYIDSSDDSLALGLRSLVSELFDLLMA